MSRSYRGSYNDSRIEIDDPGDWQHFQRLREIADAKREYQDAKRAAYSDLLSNNLDESDVATMVRIALQDYLATLAPAVRDTIRGETYDGKGTPELQENYWEGILLGTVPLPDPPFQIGNKTVVDVYADPAEFQGLKSILDAPEYVRVTYEYQAQSVGKPAETRTVVQKQQIPLRVLAKAGEIIELMRRDLGFDIDFAPANRDLIEEPI